MGVKDFEQAIEALNCNIDIDEMRIRKSNVFQVTGHTESLKVVWDELGRAFSMPVGQDTEIFICLDSNRLLSGRRLQRDPDFDLKFD